MSCNKGRYEYVYMLRATVSNQTEGVQQSACTHAAWMRPQL